MSIVASLINNQLPKDNQRDHLKHSSSLSLPDISYSQSPKILSSKNKRFI